MIMSNEPQPHSSPNHHGILVVKEQKARSKDSSTAVGDSNNNKKKTTMRRSKSNSDRLDMKATTNNNKSMSPVANRKNKIPRVKSFDGDLPTKELLRSYRHRENNKPGKRRNRSSSSRRNNCSGKLTVRFSDEPNTVHMLPSHEDGNEMDTTSLFWYSKDDLDRLLDHETRLTLRRRGKDSQHCCSRGLEHILLQGRTQGEDKATKIKTYVRVVLREQRMWKQRNADSTTSSSSYAKELRTFSIGLTKEDRKKALQLGLEDASVQRKEDADATRVAAFRASTGSDTTTTTTTTTTAKSAAISSRPTLLSRVGSMSRLLVSRDVASKCA